MITYCACKESKNAQQKTPLCSTYFSCSILLHSNSSCSLIRFWIYDFFGYHKFLCPITRCWAIRAKRERRNWVLQSASELLLLPQLLPLNWHSGSFQSVPTMKATSCRYARSIGDSCGFQLRCVISKHCDRVTKQQLSGRKGKGSSSERSASWRSPEKSPLELIENQHERFYWWQPLASLAWAIWCGSSICVCKNLQQPCSSTELRVILLFLQKKSLH